MRNFSSSIVSDESQTPEANVPGRLECIRFSPFSLLERLKLIDLALSEPSCLPFEPYWKKAVLDKKISSQAYDWIISAPLTEVPHANIEPRKNAQAVIGPFVIPPHSEDSEILSFFGEDRGVE